METRTERVVLETPDLRITGDLTLPSEGYRSRLTDFLNRGDVAFIPLVNVEIVERGGADAGPVLRQFIAVARAQVQLAYPYNAD